MTSLTLTAHQYIFSMTFPYVERDLATFLKKKHVYLKLISWLNANASVFKIILKIHDVVIFLFYW